MLIYCQYKPILPKSCTGATKNPDITPVEVYVLFSL